MTEYDFSSEAYDHYIRTQSRVASWVHHTEHHRPTFEAAAPGAPGLPPAPRSQSPPVLPRLSQAYARPPIYHRVPPSPSSSEASYVHVVSPQIRRYRPPPPPIYAPPVPPRSSFPVQPHPSPHDYLSQHRHSKSHSYSHQFPPPVATPIYTSPPISPQPIIYGYPNAWPTKVSLFTPILRFNPLFLSYCSIAKMYLVHAAPARTLPRTLVLENP